jgi:GcrA cell cycle regulator
MLTGFSSFPYRERSMSWTDDRVALLKKMWSEGKTAAEIAKELGGVTRNAVIGKAHRLKLSNRVSPIQQNNKKPAPVIKAAPQLAERKIFKAPAQDNRKGIPLVDLKASECRWPLGDPRDAHFGFCGHRQIAGLPYCAEHAKVAYQAATRNRILKAEEMDSEVTAEELALARKAVNKK